MATLLKSLLFVGISLLSHMCLAQVTYTSHIATIIHDHCMICHRQGEIGPMELTNYQQVKNWGPMIQYVTQEKLMPPWKADPHYSRFLDENFLTEEQINAIAEWVENDMPYGDASEEPAPPIFPENSLLGEPDLVLTFDQAHFHPGNGRDQYWYFVLPTGLEEDKVVKAIELRPGNSKIVHHALLFHDADGQARGIDDENPDQYGFPSSSGTGLMNLPQYPGYVPGQKPRLFPDGLGQVMEAGSDLVVQMHYAPFSIDQTDSSSINIFFARDDEPIERFVQDVIMLPFHLEGGFSSFFLNPGDIKTFHGQITAPVKVSMIGIFPHMHYLGQSWEVYIENVDGSIEPLIRINDWDFNWQGSYYFNRYKIVEQGATVHAIAKYDNTAGNPNNPSNPPRFVTWGEGSEDEMFYLPLLFVPYRPGDEDVVFEDISSSTQRHQRVSATDIERIYPNPASGDDFIHIEFYLQQGQAVSMQLLDRNGQLVRSLKQNEFFGSGHHIAHVQAGSLPAGTYFVVLSAGGHMTTQSIVIAP